MFEHSLLPGEHDPFRDALRNSADDDWWAMDDDEPEPEPGDFWLESDPRDD